MLSVAKWRAPPTQTENSSRENPQTSQELPLASIMQILDGLITYILLCHVDECDLSQYLLLILEW